MEVNGNVALVTGAASGLGEATARRLHAHGASVVLADLTEERGRAIEQELGSNTIFVKCDITSEDDVAAAVAAGAELGRLSMSVHCAGGGIAGRTVGRDGTPHDLDAFRRMTELNLVGTFNVLRLVAAQMSKNEPDAGGERGVCVNTASIAGYEGQIGQIAYGSAKAGVIGMTVIAARDLAAMGVRVCAIAPGHDRHPGDDGRAARRCATASRRRSRSPSASATPTSTPSSPSTSSRTATSTARSSASTAPCGSSRSRTPHSSNRRRRRSSDDHK